MAKQYIFKFSEFVRYVQIKAHSYTLGNSAIAAIIVDALCDWTTGVEYAVRALFDSISVDEDDEEGYDWRWFTIKFFEGKGLEYVDAAELVDLVFAYHYVKRGLLQNPFSV